MKKLITILICICALFPFCETKPQEKTITVSGWFDENNSYRSPFLSQEIGNILFCELKGLLSEPKRGFYMKLDEASALKAGQTEILVVPANESGAEHFWWGIKGKMTIDVCPLPGDEYIFYCNDEKLISPAWKQILDKEAAFWENPHSLDLDYENIDLSAKNRFIPLYIKQLDNHNKITLSRTIVKESEVDRMGKPAKKEILLADSFKLDITPYYRYVKNHHGQNETSFWLEEFTISDLASDKLKEVYFPDIHRIPEALQRDTSKTEALKKWYSSMPVPLFEKPDINLTNEQVKWDWIVPHYKGYEKFYQHKESRNIYLFLSKRSYMFDTMTDSLITIEEKLSDYNPEIWEPKEEFKSEEAKSWIENERGYKRIYSYEYYLLPDDDILITLVYSNGFQEQLHVYLMKKGASEPYKKLYVDSLVPIENSSDWGIHIMTVFQAHGKYYLMANINRSKAYWIVLNKEMFLNVD